MQFKKETTLFSNPYIFATQYVVDVFDIPDFDLVSFNNLSLGYQRLARLCCKYKELDNLCLCNSQNSLCTPNQLCTQ